MTTAWVIRGGSAGENEQFALDNHMATVAWDVPDMSPCHTREDVRDLVDKLSPGDTPSRRGAQAGQLWAFRGSIKVDDVIIMPMKTKSGYLAFGRCTGSYRYDPDASPGRRHQLPVKWRDDPVSKIAIKDDLLYSLNAIRTVFSPSRNNAVSRLEAVMATGSDPGNNSQPMPNTVAGPLSVPQDSGDADVTDPEPVPSLEAIQDRIRVHLVENFSGHKLTQLVADILEALGFVCLVSPAGPDGGVDILAGTGPLGLDSPTLIVEVKSEPTPVSASVVRGLHSAMTQYQADQALLIAWGGVTKPASREFAHVRTRLRIWDADDLLERLFATYDRLPAATKMDLPLKMAWVLADGEDS